MMNCRRVYFVKGVRKKYIMLHSFLKKIFTQCPQKKTEVLMGELELFHKRSGKNVLWHAYIS
jgi:phage-related protein